MRDKTKKTLDSRKRFFADCSNCTASFDADRREDTQKRCSCGSLLAWNDKDDLKNLEGVR